MKKLLLVLSLWIMYSEASAEIHVIKREGILQTTPPTGDDIGAAPKRRYYDVSFDGKWITCWGNGDSRCAHDGKKGINYDPIDLNLVAAAELEIANGNLSGTIISGNKMCTWTSSDVTQFNSDIHVVEIVQN